MFKKDYFWIEDKYLDSFNSASLVDSTRFYNNGVGQLIRAEAEKSIHFFKVETSGSTIGFYVKNERPSLLSHFKYMLKRRSVYKLNTRHELDLIRLYQNQGIAVVEPVALGEQNFFGIPIRGFLIQREVVGYELVDLIKKGTAEERIQLIKAYGKFVAVLHSKGLISTVPRVTDLICTSFTNTDWQNISLVVIDREKGPLELESYSLDKVGYALSSIFVRFLVYIDHPSTKEIKSFLRVYIENLKVPCKPSLQDILTATQIYFDVMIKKYIKHIEPVVHESICASIDKIKI